MSEKKNSNHAPPPPNTTPENSNPQDTPLSPALLSSSSDIVRSSDDDPRELRRTVSGGASPGTATTEDKTLPSRLPQSTSSPEVPNAETSHNSPPEQTSLVPHTFGPDDLTKVSPVTELVEKVCDIITSSTPVDGPSSNSSLHAHFGEDPMLHGPSEKSSRNAFGESNDRNAVVFPQRSHTRTPFTTSFHHNEMANASASNQKSTAAEHESTPATIPHGVRSTTIPSTLHPQPTHPEEVFSEPNPFSQIYPPRQRCESRSCAMRRSALNAMSCNLLSDHSSSPSPATEPSSPPPYPTEPVLVEMTSEDHTSSLQSEYFMNVSAWNELSTLPTTTTPSGRSNNSEDILSFLGSSDVPQSQFKLRDLNPPNNAPEQGPTTKQDAPPILTMSDEKVLALLSPSRPENCSTSVSNVEEITSPKENLFPPSSGTEPKDKVISERLQVHDKEETVNQTKDEEPVKDQQNVGTSKNDSPIGTDGAIDRQNETTVQPLPSSQAVPPTLTDVNSSRKFNSSLMLAAPPTLNQNLSKPQPSSEERSTTSESSSAQVSTENTDFEQTTPAQYTRPGESRSRDANSNQRTHKTPKPQR